MSTTDKTKDSLTGRTINKYRKFPYTQNLYLYHKTVKRNEINPLKEKLMKKGYKVKLIDLKDRNVRIYIFDPSIKTSRKRTKTTIPTTISKTSSKEDKTKDTLTGRMINRYKMIKGKKYRYQKTIKTQKELSKLKIDYSRTNYDIQSYPTKEGNYRIYLYLYKGEEAKDRPKRRLTKPERLEIIKHDLNRFDPGKDWNTDSYSAKIRKDHIIERDFRDLGRWIGDPENYDFWRLDSNDYTKFDKKFKNWARRKSWYKNVKDIYIVESEKHYLTFVIVLKKD